MEEDPIFKEISKRIEYNAKVAIWGSIGMLAVTGLIYAAVRTYQADERALEGKMRQRSQLEQIIKENPAEFDKTGKYC